MRTLVIGVLVLLALAGGAYYWLAPGRGTPAAPAEQATPQLDEALYPLYPARWSEPAVTTADGAPVVEVEATAATDTTDIAAVTTPFTTYYRDKLASAGWQPDMSREAGGPGAEVSYYTKGDQFLIVSFHSVFKVQHPDAPSECPCDVTLQLASGTAGTP